MPNSQGHDQYAGLSHGQSCGDKYADAPRVPMGGGSVRLLMPHEVDAFKARMQRIVDGTDKLKPIKLPDASVGLSAEQAASLAARLSSLGATLLQCSQQCQPKTPPLP